MYTICYLWWWISLFYIYVILFGSFLFLLCKMAATDIIKGRAYIYPLPSTLFCLTLRKVHWAPKRQSPPCNKESADKSSAPVFFVWVVFWSAQILFSFDTSSSLLSTDEPFYQLLAEARRHLLLVWNFVCTLPGGQGKTFALHFSHLPFIAAPGGRLI